MFSNHHHLRPRIVPESPRALEPAAPGQLELFVVDTSKLAPLSFFSDGEPPSHKSSRRLSWAQLLARVFDIDITRCPRCDGRLKLLGAVTHPDAIAAHLHGPARAPPRALSLHQPTLF